MAPSKATPLGEVPATGKVPSTTPSLARNLLTVASPRLVTQMFAPSKAAAQGSFPTAKVPSTEPSLARNLLTVLAPKLTTHILAPSKANAIGVVPVVKLVVWFAPNQCRTASWLGFWVESTTPLCARTDVDIKTRQNDTVKRIVLNIVELLAKNKKSG